METNNNWAEILKPLIAKYKNKKHPLDYNNLYELMIMVILSAQDSDANINKVASNLFKEFPNLRSLAATSVEELIPHLTKVRNFNTKAH